MLETKTYAIFILQKKKKEYPHYVNEYYGVGVISLLAWNSICILQTRLLSTTTLIQL